MATPYSKYKEGVEAAFRHSAKAAGHLFNNGVVIFAPICHSHPIAAINNIGGTIETWAILDEPFLNNAIGIIVIKMPGWDESTGIAWEIEYMKSLNKPVLYMEWPIGE